MGELLCAIVGPVIESLMVPIKRHVGYIVSSTIYVNEMGAKMKQLDDTSIDVQKRIELNNSNNLEIPTRVLGWLEEVEKIKNNVQSISSYRNRCFNMNLRYQTARKASKITLEMERLIKENHDIIWINNPKPLGKVNSNKGVTSTLSTGDAQSDFKSRGRIFKDALEFFKQDDRTQVLALCGMGGVGKTTMMEQLKEVVVNQKLFKWVVKVVIGETSNMFSIQQAIAEYVGKPLTEKTLTIRADLLRVKYEHMLEEGNILIILDDIWEMVELKDIGLSPFPNGCKLILTSRFEDICTRIAVDANCDPRILRVPVLEEAEAEKFFSRITKISKEDDTQLYQIGCKIVKRCGYLPLAIKLIASTLKHQKKPIWRSTLNRLKRNDLDNNVQKIIEISYNHIKEDEVKAIFLLCGLFPEDFNIPIEDLTRYAWGLKLFKEVQTFGDARDWTYTCVSNLKSANLLMDGDYSECVKMHDLVLAFVLGSASKSDDAWIINHGDTTKMSGVEMNKSCKRISLTCTGMSEFPIDFKYPNLSLLKLMQGDKSLMFPDDFYEKMEELEVVAYDEMQYPLLPRALQCSTNLRTLCFHKCLLNLDLSPIGELVNLEVLSFANCYIRKLPSTIKNLKKLILLDLTGCFDLCIDEGVFKGLVKLEELYMRVAYEKAFNFTDGNFEELAEISKNLFALEFEFFRKNVLARKMSFKNLERFKISMGCFLKRIEEENKHSFENTLMLVTSRSELLEFGVDELFDKTEVFHLEVNGMNDFEDILMESRHPYQDSFCNLRVLNISKCANLKFLFTFSLANGLKKLEHLTISSCPVLEVLVYIENSRGEVIGFPKLKSLLLDGLPELIGFSNIVNVIELPELVELKLDDLQKITSIFSENDGSTASLSSTMSSIFNNEVVIPKLETLKIHTMENLKEIWPWQFNSSEEVNACILREIEVKGCNGLVSLFPDNPMPQLHHLERLEVSNCGSIEVLFDIDLVRDDKNEHDNSRLRSVEVYQLAKFREIWRVKGVNTCDHLVSAFQAVESISVRDCKRFRNIFAPTTINFDFRALIKIDINTWELDNITAGNDELGESRDEKRNDISKGEISEVNESNIAFSSNHLVHSFHHLRELSIRYSTGIDYVFEIERTTNWNNRQLLPNLQSLRLHAMMGMSHIWNCNWNRFFSSQQKQQEVLLFNNLTSIHMSSSDRIKYLLSSLMAKHLSNLKNIKISNCDGIEEVVSSRDDGNEEMSTLSTTTTLFPRLDKLRLIDLPCLQRIDGGGLRGGSNKIVNSNYHHILQYSKKIRIEFCHALSSVIPFNVVRHIHTLEELVVIYCASIKDVFEIEGVNDNTNVGGESSDAMTIPRLPNTSLLQLPNLRILCITSCYLLEHIFISSVLESLRKLEDLTVEYCRAMQVIVKEDTEHTTTSKVVVFPRLKSLTLRDLPNLKGFLSGMEEFTFEWPLLDEVKIDGCPQMIKFTPGHCFTPKLNYVRTRIGTYNLKRGLNFDFSDESSTTPQGPHLINLLQFPWSLSNLIQFHVHGDDYKELSSERILFPHNELSKLQNLEKLHVGLPCYDLFSKTEEVFGTTQGQGTSEDEDDDDDDVNKTQTLMTFPNLKEVILDNFLKLRYIWKSSQWMTLNFPNLTKVSIYGCFKLEHVFTYGMVGSLLQLQELEVTQCNDMEVIIKQREDYEMEVNEIVFPCLKSIKLDCLRRLKGLSLGKEAFRWPSLDTLKISACPEIMVFTSQDSITPKLKVIDTSFGSRDASQGVNSFIRTMKNEGLKF